MPSVEHMSWAAATMLPYLAVHLRELFPAAPCLSIPRGNAQRFVFISSNQSIVRPTTTAFPPGAHRTREQGRAGEAARVRITAAATAAAHSSSFLIRPPFLFVETSRLQQSGQVPD